MPRASLLSHRDFRLLWGGQSVSELGTFVTKVSIPLLAALVLAATPLQMGLLTAAEDVAFLLIGLPVGVWVDRMRRRPVMLRADLARIALLASIPVVWWCGRLTLTQLIAVSLGVSVCTVFFDVAYQSYLPALIGRSQLVEGNAKLQASQSSAEVSGPALGGGLTQLAGAANAVLADAVSYLVSALCLWRIRTPEPEPDRPTVPNLRAEIGEGLRFVFGSRALRAIVGCTATSNFCMNITMSVAILMLTRHLGASAGTVGLLMSSGSAGGVLGAVCARRIGSGIGQTRTIWLSLTCSSPFMLLLPLTGTGDRLLLYPLGFFVGSFGAVVYNVAQLSFRQALCPDRLLGRMNASVRFVVWGTLPLGGLLGGVLGSWIGIRPTMWVAAIGIALAPLWLLCSPLRHMRELPEPAEKQLGINDLTTFTPPAPQ
ncbi:MAG: MFS transporter [Sciscionella sp.]